MMYIAQNSLEDSLQRILRKRDVGVGGAPSPSPAAAAHNGNGGIALNSPRRLPPLPQHKTVDTRNFTVEGIKNLNLKNHNSAAVSNAEQAAAFNALLASVARTQGVVVNGALDAINAQDEQEGDAEETFELVDIFDEDADQEAVVKANLSSLQTQTEEHNGVEEFHLSITTDDHNHKPSVSSTQVPPKSVKNRRYREPAKYILNGYWKSEQPVQPDITIDIEDGDGSYITHRSHNTALLNGFIERETFHYTLEEDPDLQETIYKLERISQMGVRDFVSRLVDIFRSGSHTDIEHDFQDGSRKRRSEGHLANTTLFKYRKVANRFPKYLASSNVNDDVEVIGELSPPKKRRSVPMVGSSRLQNYPKDMTEQGTHNGLDERPKLRKSFFATPQTTHKLVKNTAFADIEFSDDDEPLFVNGFYRDRRGYTETDATAANHSNQQPNKVNSDLRGVECETSTHKKPPPLLRPLMANRMPDSARTRDPDASPKLRYSDVLKQNVNSAQADGRLGYSIYSSGASTSYNNMHAIPWPGTGRSILNQVKVNDDREKYQQLLEQVMPRLYGNENAHVPNSSCDQQSSRPHSSILRAPITSTVRRSFLGNHNAPSFKQNALMPKVTIDLDDYDEYDADVAITGFTQPKKRPMRNQLPTVIIDDDNSDIIELHDGDKTPSPTDANARQNIIIDLVSQLDKKCKPEQVALPFVEPVNTLKERFNSSPHLKENWLHNWEKKWEMRRSSRAKETSEAEKIAKKIEAERTAAEREIHERLKNVALIDPTILVIDDFPELLEPEVPEFVEFTEKQNARFQNAICGPPDQVLITKFNLNITRRDLHTLLGNNWLNDEVINFYMNLLTERGEKKSDSHGLPTVYAMNTFFVQRLLQVGHSGVKRWTRKVDIFSRDIIPVPVHVGGVHWCMAIIHLKNRSIRYYDSMGTPNPSVLRALEQYLKDESLDKLKQPFDTSNFEIESVADVPRQMNGSDCGVFSCMFAEYITRNKQLTFAQQHMEYFRRKMVLEIVQGELLQ